MICPLPTIAEEKLEQGVRSLMPKCRAAGCSYVNSDHDTDYLPANCILIVVALCDPSRPSESKGTDR